MDARLEEGTKAPAFTLLNADGNPVSLKEYLGYKVILYFYPEAMTAGCTTEACDFSDNLASLTSAGYKVLGVSRDLPAKLRAFAERDHLGFELLSDPDRTAHEAYRVWGEKQLYGKAVVGVIRSTFVLDEKGVIVMALYNVKATGHVAMLRKRLGVAA